uniref:Uncharacterized protein n=1 Tax=Panagrolaimus sp. JU765 TaxID=591449 RepID=A0AC34QSW9_9BILA
MNISEKKKEDIKTMFWDKIEASVEAANRAASIANQKADIAASRTQTAQERAEAADAIAMRAKGDADVARITATQFDPNFVQPGIQALRKNRETNRVMLNNIGGAHANHVSFDSTLSTTSVPPSTSALGSRMTHSYQQLPMGNHRPAAAPTTNYPMSNRIADSQHQLDQIADSQHQLDQYSKSFDYSNAIPASTSHNPGAGHIADNYEQTLAHQQLAAQTAPDRPQLPQSPSSSNPTSTDLVNDGASTSATLRLSPEGRVLSAEQQSIQSEANPSLKSANPNEFSPRVTPLKRGRQGGGSILSLSDDHFDQYTLSRNLSEAEGTKLRRNRPSLTRQSEVNADLGGINRRSTMASASDRKNAPITRNTSSKGLESREDRGSLPNIAELEGTGIKLNREDAARLASQRRQEAQRIMEEEELLRANPLRYLFHPALRNWIIQRKVQILLILANCFLLEVPTNMSKIHPKKSSEILLSKKSCPKILQIFSKTKTAFFQIELQFCCPSARKTKQFCLSF